MRLTHVNSVILSVALLTLGGAPHLTVADEKDPLSIFNRRILPIMQASNPSSCSECHLSGVDLKDYIGTDQATTFASLRERGLIDLKKPNKSKILEFIARKPKKPNLITDKVRQQEYEAFRAWILAAVKDPKLLKTATSVKSLGPKLPVELIRHARKDRVLASFIDNIWTEVARCSGCHSPDQNQKQVKEFGEQVSWITLRDPEATLAYMLEAELIDVDKPDQSLLLLKPTLQVEHEGGQKLLVGDRTYKQFRRFIDDYAAVVKGKYKTEDELPKPSDELAVATAMKNGIWLKLSGVPARYDKMLLQVDLYRRDRRGWSKDRWATADRGVFGKGKLWQQTLTLTAPRQSRRADKIRRVLNLPAGEYLAKIYIDQKGKLRKDLTAQLGETEFVGNVVVKSQWPKGYGRMTVAKFPTR